VSISKRLFDFARSELNSLLDRAAELDGGHGDDDEDVDPVAQAEAEAAAGASSPTAARTASARGRTKVRLEDLSDDELEAEIERRRLDRELNDRAAEAAARATSQARANPARGASGRGRTSTPSVPVDPIARAYAALEVPPGSDFEAVRKQYRALMRKYHPDRHTASPEKQKAANELAQKLTDAYKTLERRLRTPTSP
jgi:DnaJ-domain-containing protein 1